MILYHGSRTGGITELEPRLADHDRPYIYLTTLEVVAAFYLCNAVERPYYWFPYGFQKGAPDIPVYDELYPNALREVSEGVSGWIYIVEASEKDVIPFGANPCAWLGTKPLKVQRSIYIPDAYEQFLQYLRQGKMGLGRYEDMTERHLQFYHQMIREHMRRKQMHLKQECSYARFVREKFPEVWEQFMREQLRRSSFSASVHSP